MYRTAVQIWWEASQFPYSTLAQILQRQSSYDHMCGECSIHATEVRVYEVLVGKTERKRTLRQRKCKLEHNTARTSTCTI